jgi:hypothetical protein
MTDDAIREVHGCAARESDNKARLITIAEGEQYIRFPDTLYAGTKMTPYQARYLAAKLYRLARRVRQRAEAITLATTPTREGEG